MKVWYELDDEERIQCRRCDNIVGKDEKVQMEITRMASTSKVINVLCEECVNAPTRTRKV